MTLQEATDGFLNEVGSRISTRSLWIYRRDLHKVNAFIGSLRLADLTRQHARALVTALSNAGESPATIRGRLRSLKALLSSAVDNCSLQSNPLWGYRSGLAKSPKRPIFSKAQLVILLKTGERLHGPIIGSLWYLMAHAGLRMGESLVLRAEDIDLASRTLEISHSYDPDYENHLGPTKSRQPRSVKMGSGLTTRLYWLVAMNPGPFIFSTDRVQPICPRRANRKWVELRNELGLSKHYVPHCLRHTYATLLVSDGVPLPFLQRQLGHGSISTTIDLYGARAQISADAHLTRLEEDE